MNYTFYEKKYNYLLNSHFNNEFVSKMIYSMLFHEIKLDELCLLCEEKNNICYNLIKDKKTQSNLTTVNDISIINPSQFNALHICNSFYEDLIIGKYTNVKITNEFIEKYIEKYTNTTYENYIEKHIGDCKINNFFSVYWHKIARINVFQTKRFKQIRIII